MNAWLLFPRSRGLPPHWLDESKFVCFGWPFSTVKKGSRGRGKRKQQGERKGGGKRATRLLANLPNWHVPFLCIQKGVLQKKTSRKYSTSSISDLRLLYFGRLLIPICLRCLLLSYMVGYRSHPNHKFFLISTKHSFPLRRGTIINTSNRN